MLSSLHTMSHKGRAHACMLSMLHTVSHKGRAHVCMLASLHFMSHRGREHLCMLSMLHTMSYRGREHMCMHHLCCYKPKTIARVEPDCVEPTDKQMDIAASETLFARFACWDNVVYQMCTRFGVCVVQSASWDRTAKYIRLCLQGMLCGGVPSS